MTDSQLLERYIVEQDNASFRALVARHGPTVLGVCRRALQDPHDVEDAFQATFLVLVRKASSIRNPETLGCWLYGVAHRTAARARRGDQRRRRHESRKAELHPAHATDQPRDDLIHVVREELGRLPAPYRAPLELCYLRGLSHEEAASELGWPLGTLKTRLVRGRRQLRERLDRRRIAPGMALLVLLLSPRRSEAVPPELLESTIGAMRREASAGPRGEGRPLKSSESSVRGLIGSRLRPRMLCPLLILLAASLAATWGLSRVSQARAVELEAFASLPANLTDVLKVKCR